MSLDMQAFGLKLSIWKKITKVNNSVLNMNICIKSHIYLINSCRNVSPIMTRNENQGTIKVSRIRLLGDTNVCYKFHSNPSKNCWDIPSAHLKCCCHIETDRDLSFKMKQR